MGQSVDRGGFSSNRVEQRMEQIERDLRLLMASLDSMAPRGLHDSAYPSAFAQGAHLSAAFHRDYPAADRLRGGKSPRNGSEPLSFTAARARHVRKLIRQRRQRDQFFQADLFADPAWDMMLDLYAAHYEGREVSVSSLCIAAAVPATTALRWIKIMVDNGQFIRLNDPEDGRRIHVRLGDEARARLDEYFDNLEV